MSILNGYKTYLTAIGGIVSAIVAAHSGYITPEQAIQTVWQAIVAMTIRHGIANA